ncbi:MAG: PTS fructose transporter subunit IIA [Deltaproteobacteria bacterium]|nr:MAG: PTS fructose transporter subunit IIA [Deltaproteobacteria bacterium]
MIGILVVTHGGLGKSLIETAKLILGTMPENVKPVCIDLTSSVDDLHARLASEIKHINTGHGVLLLTDMFGGTPSNLSYSLLDEGKVEVISGVNLPVLLKAISKQQDTDLTQVARLLEVTGKRSISTASGILQGNTRRAE